MAPPHSSTTGNGQNLAVAFAPSAFITGPPSGSHNGSAPTGSNNRDISAQTSPTRSLGNADSPTDEVKKPVAGSTGGGSAVLDAIQAAVVAASSPQLETPKSMVSHDICYLNVTQVFEKYKYMFSTLLFVRFNF